MVGDNTRRRLPPYISYRTYRNFIEGLQQAMPARIDRSFWGDKLSGSTGTQLMAALRFLGMIDTNSIPTNRLKLLATARGEKRTELLRQMTAEAFGFLFQGQIDLQNATYAQLHEVFHNNFQLTTEVSRKCIKFFIALANDAGMPLSSFITKRLRTTHTNPGTKITKKTAARTNKNLTVPKNLESAPFRTSWDETLITKFPTFDPSWTDEVKLKWFDAFDELLKRGSTRSGN